MKHLELDGVIFSGLDKGGNLELEFDDLRRYIYIDNKDIQPLIDYLKQILIDNTKVPINFNDITVNFKGEDIQVVGMSISDCRVIDKDGLTHDIPLKYLNKNH